MIRFVAIFFVLLCAEVIINVESRDATTIFINSLADRGLRKLAIKLREKNQETLKLPDKEITIRKTFPHVKILWKGGTFGSLYTWKRAGDVSLTMDGYTLTLNATTTFERGVFNFREFRASVGPVELGDSVKIVIKKNKVLVQATLLLTESGFKVNVDNVVMPVFEDFHAERRKNGELQSDASNSVLTFVLNAFHEKLRKLLSKVLKKVLESVLEKYDLL